MTSEASIQRKIQTELTDADTRLWRVQVGNFLLADGRRVISGVPGMSDLLGLHSVLVTHEMVGRRLAVFTAIEVKAPNGHTQRSRLDIQTAFIDTVNRMGGLAGFATSVDEALDVLAGGGYS